jgi:putative ABC transport system permease protein
VKVWLGDGTPATLHVAATYARPLGFGEILLPRALAERHASHPVDDMVFVQGRPGVSTAALGAGLARLSAGNPDLKLATRAQYRSQVERAEQDQSLEVYVLLGLIVAFCALALVNATTMSTSDRAREFAVLRLAGAGRRQVRAMMRAETLIVVTFGLTVGTLIALPGLAVLSRTATGSALPSVPLWLFGAMVAFYALLGFAATILPTRSALRVNPVTAIAARD